MSFTSFDLHPDLLRALDEMSFAVPTPIQKEAIPPVMSGRDVLATAVTGSGKTAAFLLPILHRLMGVRRGVTRALVLTPTRELAAQIDEHRRQLARYARIAGAAVFGGVSMQPQEQAFRRGVDVLVATPGRLLDHLQYPYARLDALQSIVLDEADRMLDMGFLPDIRRVLKQLPARRQTLLFSATMPPPIVTLAHEILHDPLAVNVGRPPTPAAGIAHTVYPVPRELKSGLLLELLRGASLRSVLTFTRTKHRANRLAEFLARHGVASDRIHGNRSQAQRTQALAQFKGGRLRVLVATDVAARGIDIAGLSHVVNFDVPAGPEDYVHRVGRTARMEALGDALTLVSPDEEAGLRVIERSLGTRLARVTLPGFDYRHRPAEQFEVPLAERIAAIRTRKNQERAVARRRADRAR
ncbi:MAG: DEAD/DEAH box helicase [Candidatus Rokuibacteriota bacterium]